MRSANFRMSRARCYILMLLHQAPIATLLLCLLMASLTVAGFLFSPYIGVATIGVDAFLIVMLLTFVIAVYGFHSVTGCNMADHSLEQTDENVKVIFEDGKEIEISKKEILPYKIYPGGVLVPVKGERAGWLWVPPKAFDTPDEFSLFLKSLYSVP